MEGDESTYVLERLLVGLLGAREHCVDVARAVEHGGLDEQVLPELDDAHLGGPVLGLRVVLCARTHSSLRSALDFTVGLS